MAEALRRSTGLPLVAVRSAARLPPGRVGVVVRAPVQRPHRNSARMPWASPMPSSAAARRTISYGLPEISTVRSPAACRSRTSSSNVRGRESRSPGSGP